MPDRTNELKLRVEAKKKELDQKLTQLRADATGAKNDEIDRIEGKLSEINNIVKDSWDDISENAVEKINNWLR